MGEPATKLPTKPKQSAPDPTKPIAMYYWALPIGQKFGNSANNLAMVGGSVHDGEGTSGEVTDITLYPGGVVIIEVQPMNLQQVGERPPKQYVPVLGIGHGSAMWDAKLEELMARGKWIR